MSQPSRGLEIEECYGGGWVNQARELRPASERSYHTLRRDTSTVTFAQADTLLGLKTGFMVPLSIRR